MPIKLFFITGFLGSGKTTLLNNLLSELKNTKTGIIINEFGQINIDKNLIKIDKEKKIVEINNGSIFCSCLSHSFVKSILNYQGLAIEHLIVESTGLARPASINTILAEVDKKAPGRFNYQGMACVVDAPRFLSLIQVLVTLKEQVFYSDTIIINKIDLVEEKTISKIEKKIKEINPKAKIIKTSFSQVEFSALIKDKKKQEKKQNLEFDMSSSSSPETFVLRVKEEVKKADLLSFLEKIVSETYRIKGFLATDKAIVLVDGVQEELKVSEIVSNENKDLGLVIITKEKGLLDKIKRLWQQYLSAEVLIEKK